MQWRLGLNKEQLLNMIHIRISQENDGCFLVQELTIFRPRGKKTPSHLPECQTSVKGRQFSSLFASSHWAATSSSKWVRTNHGACPPDDVEDCKACEHCVNMGRWVSDVPRLPSHQFSLHTCAPLPAWTKLLLYSKHEHKMREKPGIPQASGKVIQRAGRKKPLIACRSELHLCTNSYQLSPTLPVLKSEVFARWIIRAWHLSAEWESYWTAATVSWGVNHVPERTFESVRYCVVCV